jgi:sugar/nucleoside kinase (ribokinase family)
VILVGEKGSYVSSNDNHLHIPTLNITPVDTTGAGDLYAAGFLHGYIHGRPLKTCAAWGNLTGGAVIQHVGAEIPEYEWINLRQKMKQH